MSDSEKTALFEALSDWRAACRKRYQPRDSLAMLLEFEHYRLTDHYEFAASFFAAA